MGLNFFVGEVQVQANAASVVAQQAIQAVGLLQDGINQFLQAPLSGKTYDTAKRYFSVAYAPLKQGVILTCEALTQAHQKFLSEYSSQVGGGDIQEDEIRDRINQGYSLMASIQDLMAKEDKFNPRLERRYENAFNAVKLLEERLQKLYAFNASSAAIFSDYEARLAELTAGIAAISSSGAWNANSGTFTISKLDMKWAKPIQNNWDKREKKLKETAKISDKKYSKGKDFLENTVFPINQDTAMGLSEEWLINNGDKVATGLYNTGTKYFGGTEVASGFYASSKVVGAAGKAMPIVGAAIDYGSMVASGESAHDALAKTGAHVIAGVGIGLAVGAVVAAGLPVVGGIVVGAVAGYYINGIIDFAYDSLKKPVGNAIKSLGKWGGSLWK
ncbi:hypothetical protein GIX45_26250 [Erwinia sp. CPCC 100877]|nr:hypothetical protein [Erwinia sp. CPCC 100877]